jgi:hypothetical protein
MNWANVIGAFPGDSFEVEAVGEPAEDYECWARDGWYSKEYKLRIVPCAGADARIWERLFMSKILWYLIDYYKGREYKIRSVLNRIAYYLSV